MRLVLLLFGCTLIVGDRRYQPASDMAFGGADGGGSDGAVSVFCTAHELLVNGTRSAAAKTFFEGTGSDSWTTTPDELATFQTSERIR